MVDTKKVIYFILAMVFLVLLQMLIINHMDNKVLVRGIDKEEKVVLESFIDDSTGIMLKYELSSEILKDDVFLIRDKKITKKLKKQDVIEYFSVSLYDSENIKKSIKNSNYTIYFPLNDNINEYNEIKVVRLNKNAEITEEKFSYSVEDNYIVFDVTMSSKYAIIGIKK